MAPPLLILRDIALGFGGTELLEGAELFVSAGERLCLVGRNGSGKSTLLRIAAGLAEADAGERFVQPGTTIHYLPQEPDFSGYATVAELVSTGLAPGDDPHRVRYLLEHLGLDGRADPAFISGGEARRAALARVLAPAPDILLLDEPTNHLDLPAIEWLEAELSAMASALVLVSHDRRFLENLSRRTLWLDRGRVRALNKGFAAFEAWRDDILEREETERHKLDRKIARETEWLRKGVTARRKRNQGRLRALAALRTERQSQRMETGVARLEADAGAASGRLVIEAESVAKSFQGRVIVRDFSVRVLRGERVALVGANGAGKTTLLNILTGALAPDTGNVRLGTGLEMVTLDQRRESLAPETTLAEALTGGGGDMVAVAGGKRHVIGYMKDFLFTPEQARTPVSVLSGGERGRLMLARALARPANLLVLDEPTNDLDLETLDLLQEMLAEFDGTVLLVSHDRDFLDRVATSVIAAEGDGRWQNYAGGYSDMMAQRGGALAAPASQEKPDRKPAGKVLKRAAPPARRLTFKDKHALETLPGRMAALEAEIARHREALADPGLFRRDADTFRKTAEALEQAEAELVASEERWLALEILREESEGG